MIFIKEPIEFDWDKGNLIKNWHKHSVSNAECEEVFFDEKKKIARDCVHSGKEKRYLLIGQTKRNRLLFLVFTTRGYKIRIISARDLNQREKYLYEKNN